MLAVDCDKTTITVEYRSYDTNKTERNVVLCGAAIGKRKTIYSGDQVRLDILGSVCSC